MGSSGSYFYWHCRKARLRVNAFSKPDGKRRNICRIKSWTFLDWGSPRALYDFMSKMIYFVR